MDTLQYSAWLAHLESHPDEKVWVLEAMDRQVS
jgi:hypothetical protein